MALDKAKVIKSAEKFVSSGKIAQAIEEYLKVLKENQKDWNLMIQIGDLYLKINKSTEAIQHFQKVADHYSSDGFFLKAIAIYKRINKLDPNLTDICIKLADLYLKQGLTMDAKTQLQVVAQHYVSQNQTKDAIKTFKKLIDIEPDNLKMRNELARAYKSEGMLGEAIKEYLEISDELSRKNLWKEAITVLDTAHKLDPRNSTILRRILTIYSEQNETAKATAVLDDALKQDPTNTEVLSLLAETMAGRNQLDKAQETLDHAILASATKEPLWTLKGDLYLKAGQLDRAFAAYSLVVDRFVQKKDYDKAVQLLQKITHVDSSYHPALQKLVDVYTVMRQESNIISACNALVDAYISKTMYQDASKYLEKLINYEPENSQHQEKLEFVRSFLEKPKAGSAPAAPPPAAPMPEAPPKPKVEPVVPVPQPADAEEFEIDLDFHSEPVSVPVDLTPTPVPTVIPKPAAPVAPRKPAPVAPSSPSLQTSEEEKEFVSEHLIEAEVFTKYGLIEKAIEQLQIVVNKYPNSVVAHQKLKEIYLEKGERDKAVEECVVMSRVFRKRGDLDQAEDLLSEARQINPNHPALDKAFKETATGAPAPSAATDVLGEIEKLAQSMKSRPARQAQPPAAAKRPPEPKPAPPPPPPPPVPAAPKEKEIQVGIEEAAPAPSSSALTADAFEEIDFYLSQGLSSEARKLLLGLRERNASDPGVISRLQSLGEKEASAPVQVSIEKEEPQSVPSQEAISVNQNKPAEAAEPVVEAAANLETEEPAVEPTIEQTWDLGDLTDIGEVSSNQQAAPEPTAVEEEPEELGVEFEEEPVKDLPEIEEAEDAPDVQLDSIESISSDQPEIIVEPKEEIETIEELEEAEEEPEILEEVTEQETEPPMLELDSAEIISASEPIVEISEPAAPAVEAIALDAEPQFVEPEPEPQIVEPEPVVIVEPETIATIEPEPETPVAESVPTGEPVVQAQTEPSAEVSADIAPDFDDLGSEFDKQFDELDVSNTARSEADEQKVTITQPVNVPLELELNAAFDAALTGGSKEAEAVEVSQPVKASEDLFEEEEDFFDLAAELEDGFLNVQNAVEEERPQDGQNYSLEEILTDFKKGVEKQLGSEDYDTRYNLGIAYKEMGLIDEAIAEFQIASKDSRRFLECCSMLGLCFVEKGMPKLALKWYQKGLETQGHGEEEYQGLRFDLAHAYEVMGEMDKALEIYYEVYGANANYRNVAKKIKEIQEQVKHK